MRETARVDDQTLPEEDLAVGSYNYALRPLSVLRAFTARKRHNCICINLITVRLKLIFEKQINYNLFYIDYKIKLKLSPT
jgi:hypothetical protein